MPKRSCTTCLIAFALSFLLGGGQPVDAQEQKWLELQVESDGERYTMTDSVEFSVTIRNRGQSKVSLLDRFTWGHYGELDYKVFDAQGKPVNSLIIDDSWMAENPESEERIVLSPDDTVELKKSYRINQLVREPGSYSIAFRYVSHVKQDRASTDEGVPIWTVDDGLLVGSADLVVVK